MTDLQKEFNQELEQVKNSQDLENLRLKYLGKKGIISEKLQTIGSIPKEERKEFGAKMNQIKQFISKQVEDLSLIHI